MSRIVDSPTALFFASLVLMCLAALAGIGLHGLRRQLQTDVRDDFGVILAATLTVLGLLIAFTLSMAVTRYDKRVNSEGAEANAIGTAYFRADFLPASERARFRALLAQYLGERIAFYQARDERASLQAAAATARTQQELWSTVTRAASEQPNAVLALTVEAVNDILNSQGYAQAAWADRIPLPVWMLMLAIAVGCNVLVGFVARRARSESGLFVILPLTVALSIFLIADIDTPRGGFINLLPNNLVGMNGSMPVQPPR